MKKDRFIERSCTERQITVEHWEQYLVTVTRYCGSTVVKILSSHHNSLLLLLPVWREGGRREVYSQSE